MCIACVFDREAPQYIVYYMYDLFGQISISRIDTYVRLMFQPDRTGGGGLAGNAPGVLTKSPEVIKNKKDLIEEEHCMNLYLDTEFTGLHKDTTLISIGIISEDGRSFYAEFTDYDKSQCDDWIKKNVIEKLRFEIPEVDEDYYYIASRAPFNAIGNDFYSAYSVEMNGSRLNIANELRMWLKQFQFVQFVSDVCHYDFVLLIDLFGSAFDLPHNVSPCCHDINHDIAEYLDVTENEAFNRLREDLIKAFYRECPETLIETQKHNALYDANVIQLLHRVIRLS